MSLRWTKDEHFVVTAYELAMKAGDLETVLDRYEVGKLCGITVRAVDAISTLLARANFIRKVGTTEMYLTKNGEELALRLRQES